MTPAAFLEKMTPEVRRRLGSDRQWAAACGLPPETLSRLRRRDSCDLRTLNVLAAAAGYELTLTPCPPEKAGILDREREQALLDLCASGNLQADAWRTQGEPFFMGGLAMLLASVSGFDRRRYLELAESLHPGISHPEVFELWLRRSPLRPARFLPMLAQARKHAA